MSPPRQASVCPPRWEWLAVLFLLAGFLALDLASYNMYPAVWCDEVLYSEPAINLLRHGTYTTQTYELQPPNTFPIVNCPLYGLTLVPWLSVAGTSLLAVRSFNYTFMALAAFLLWLASWRFGLVRSALLRLGMLVVLHLGYGMSYCFRSGRPDILGMVCLLLLPLAINIPRLGLKRVLLPALAALSIWIGLQVALYALFAYLCAWLVFGKTAPGLVKAGSDLPGARETRADMTAFQGLILLGVGFAVGAGSLLLFMYSKGVLRWFLPPILGVMKGTFYGPAARHSVAGAFIAHLHRTLTSYCEDFSTVLLTPALLLLVTVWRPRLSLAVRKTVGYGLLLAFGAPALFEAVGHFAFYYSYLRYAPAVLVLFAAASDLSAAGGVGPPRGFAPVLAVTLVGAVAVGLPLRLGISVACSHLMPRATIQRTLAAQLAPTDTAFSEYLPFFEVKQLAPVVYHLYSSSVLCPTGLPGADLSGEAKRAVSVLIIRPGQKERLSVFFAGQWAPVTEPFGDTQDFNALVRLPLIGRRFASYAFQPQTERYQVQVFRRVDDHGRAMAH